MYETGHFATLWQKMAAKLGLEVEFMPSDWRRGADPEAIEKKLRADADKRIKAVCVVHNETSTGVTLPNSRGQKGDRRGESTRRFTWSTRSRRLPRSTTATMNGASTSPSPARRRA
jgi:phosphoserine aminotransferase